jgi:hypothetical protein
MLSLKKSQAQKNNRRKTTEVSTAGPLERQHTSPKR